MAKSIQPIISVCIPAYNSEKYIGKTIQSVFLQTHRDFELIIVDDCSTDRTLDIIKEYKDPRIRVIVNQKNLGLEKNWNKAIGKARGRYIKILGHDDLLYPDCLERQAEILDNEAYRDVVIVCCSRYIIDENDNIIFKRGFKNKKGQFPGRRILKETIRSGRNLIGEPTAVLFRAKIMAQIKGFNGNIPYLIDLESWSRMLLHGDVFIISDPLCTFRVSFSSLSVALRGSQHRDFKALINKLYENKEYQLTLFDCIIGKIRANLNGFLRNLFYNFVLKKNKVKKIISRVFETGR